MNYVSSPNVWMVIIASDLLSIGKGVFIRLTPEKRPLPLEAYNAHSTQQSANAL
jgi:hypothetical protein